MQAADCLYCNYSALFCLVHILCSVTYKGTTHLTWDSSPCCHPVILFLQLRMANPQPLVWLLLKYEICLTKLFLGFSFSSLKPHLYQILHHQYPSNREINDTSILQLIMVEWDIWLQKNAFHKLASARCWDVSILLNLFEQHHSQNIAIELESNWSHNYFKYYKQVCYRLQNIILFYINTVAK